MVGQAQSIGLMFHLLPLTRHANSKLSRACEMSFPWLNKIFCVSTFPQYYNNERGEDKRKRQEVTSSIPLKTVRKQGIPCWLQWGFLSHGVLKEWGCDRHLLEFHLSEEGRAHQANNKRLYVCQWQELEHLMGYHAPQSVLFPNTACFSLLVAYILCIWNSPYISKPASFISIYLIWYIK